MAVVPTNAKTLHFIDISNPESIPVQFARPVNLEYTVWSCASYKDDLVVTAATKPRSVKLIDTFGKEKWSLSTDSSGQPLFGWPGSVVCKTVKGKSVVTVADPGKDELILIDIKKVK